MEVDGRLLGMGAGTVVVIIIIILVVWLIWENEERKQRHGDSDLSLSWSDLNSLGSKGRRNSEDNQVIVLSVIALVVTLLIGGGSALYSSHYRARNPTLLTRSTSRATSRLSNLSGLGRSTRSSVL